MKVTYNWLKDFVDVRVSPEELAHKLTMAGIEVKDIEPKNGDHVFEIEITSNRPDWLSVIGLAREVAAVTGKKISAAKGSRAGKEKPARPAPKVRVALENTGDCPIYTARIIENAVIAPAPDTIRSRLESIGCRTVNNVVDITNYCMFENGQPLHAFDLDKLYAITSTPRSAELLVYVRRAREKEEIETIDGVKHVLHPDVLLITAGPDKERSKPVAIAGVMGGKDTEVTAETKNILLESANFNSVVVRVSRQHLGMQSEAAYRFERGVDRAAVQWTAHQTAAMICEHAKGVLVAVQSAGSDTVKKHAVAVSPASVEKVLGIAVSLPQIKSIMQSLGFTAKLTGKAGNKAVSVDVPSFRPDVKAEIDLIEEVARIYGYDRIPVSLPRVVPRVNAPDNDSRVLEIKQMLTGLGLTEVVTYSLVDKQEAEDAAKQEGRGAIPLVNPLTAQQGFLRVSLFTSLLKVVAHNLNQNTEGLAIFEVSRVYTTRQEAVHESRMLGLAFCGTRSWWTTQGNIKDTYGVLHIKGVVETVARRLGIPCLRFQPAADGGMIEICIGTQKAGNIRQASDAAKAAVSIKMKEVFLAELDLDMFLAGLATSRLFTPLPLYPAIVRDISLVVKDEIPTDKITATIMHQADPLLKEVAVVDLYRGKQIPSGCKALTISCLYRSNERTLTETDIAGIHAERCARLIEQCQAQIR